MKKLIITLLTSLLLSITTVSLVLPKDTIKTDKINYFVFEGYNNHISKVIYWIYWKDHNIKNFEGLANIAGGELTPGEKRIITAPHPRGKYIIIWRDSDTLKDISMLVIDIPDNTTGIIPVSPL